VRGGEAVSGSPTSGQARLKGQFGVQITSKPDGESLMLRAAQTLLSSSRFFDRHPEVAA
jgi:hypothetical protein